MEKTKDNKKCRTCLKCTKGLKLLSKTALKGSTKKERKSYADLLKDVARISIELDNGKKLPQTICRICIEKLISAYEFVQQANEVNQQLWNKFYADESCLQENPIEYTALTEGNSMQIKVEQDNSVDKWNVNSSKETEAESDEFDLPLCEIKLKIEENAEITIAEAEKEKSPTKDKSDAEIKELEDLDSVARNNEDISDEQQTDEDDDIDNLNLSLREKNKIKRMKGQEYLGVTKSDKIKTHKVISHRQVGPMCSSSFCVKSSLRHCQRFDEETRKSIFKRFWNMTWEAKREFAKKLVDQVDTKRKRVQNSKRQCSFIFKLPYKEETLQVCQPMFLSTLSLNINMVKGWVTSVKPSEVPSEDKVFKCEFCDKIYSRNADLTYHRRIHTGEKPFSCNQCGESFSLRRLLRAHVRSTHVAERPYSCPECNRTFKHLKDYTVHKRVHTGEKPYMCDSCGGKYGYIGSFNFHRLTCDPTKSNPKKIKTLDENNLEWFETS